MKLPNNENAYIDIEKLKGYCLNFSHERGKHKARLFSSILGIKKENAQQLKNIILEAVKTNDATKADESIYGKRFIVEFMLKNNKGEAKVRSTWIIRKYENYPRLTSCYIVK
jgi:hypothetical protein